MSARPFRFVHATNLRLDQPLWGIGSVTADARRIVEDATLTAFGHVVDACIGHQAACLLLTGNCFDAAHASRARMSLEAACERLAEHAIEVLIVPGETDPPHVWADGFALPPNVTTFIRRGAEPVALVRDSEVLATIEPYDDRHHHEDRDGRSSALRIGLAGAGQHAALQEMLASATGSINERQLANEFPAAAEFGYLALGNGSERFTVGLPRGVAHDPGCPQPLDGRRTSATGCSLIDVDESGRLQIKPLPTAVVRREEIPISLSEGDSWDELAEQMQTALLDRDPLPTEKLWLVRWIIDADAALAEMLTDAATQRELCDLVEEELADDRGIIRHHEMEVRRDWSQWDDIELSGSVFTEFTALVDDRLPEHADQFRRQLPALDWPEAGWVRHIIDAGERMNAPAVAAHAHNLARHHLLPTD